MPEISRTKRLIQEIQTARNSRVICLVTSDRPGFSSPMQSMQQDVVRHIYDLGQETWSHARAERLDLFIYTRGGDSNMPWMLMSTLREIVDGKELNALIPYRCHSAGTICVLGTDDIIAGPKAELGPIDTTMHSAYNPLHPKTGEPLPISVEDVSGYFSLLDEVGCTGSDSRIEGLKEFTKQVSPYALGMVQRLQEQTKLVAGQMLSSRLKRFSDAENEAIVATLSKRITSHQHAISRTEAVRHVGLNNVTRSENSPIHGALWDLYQEFESRLELLNRFAPEEAFITDEALETADHDGLKCCYVETELACRVCKTDVKITRQREQFQNLSVQPQITLQPPALPDGIDQQQVMGLLQPWMQAVPQLIQVVVNDAIQRALRAAPTRGYRGSNTGADGRMSNTAFSRFQLGAAS
jgi:hypothetical protein